MIYLLVFIRTQTQLQNGFVIQYCFMFHRHVFMLLFLLYVGSYGFLTSRCYVSDEVFHNIFNLNQIVSQVLLLSQNATLFLGPYLPKSTFF